MDKEVKRCCRTCYFCDIKRKACYEGGYTEIAYLDIELAEEDCNAWKQREDLEVKNVNR